MKNPTFSTRKQSVQSCRTTQQVPYDHNPDCLPDSRSELGAAKNTIAVSARIRPLLPQEEGSEKILEVLIRGEKYFMMQPLKEDMICLNTGAHFNNGRKLLGFKKIFSESSNQEDVFERCEL